MPAVAQTTQPRPWLAECRGRRRNGVARSCRQCQARASIASAVPPWAREAPGLYDASDRRTRFWRMGGLCRRAWRALPSRARRYAGERLGWLPLSGPAARARLWGVSAAAALCCGEQRPRRLSTRRRRLTRPPARLTLAALAPDRLVASGCSMEPDQDGVLTALDGLCWAGSSTRPRDRSSDAPRARLLPRASRERPAERTHPRTCPPNSRWITVARSHTSRMAVRDRKDGTGGHIPCIPRGR